MLVNKVFNISVFEGSGGSIGYDFDVKRSFGLRQKQGLKGDFFNHTYL